MSLTYRSSQDTVVSTEQKRGISIWRSWIRASWYNYENNQQDATI